MVVARAHWSFWLIAVLGLIWYLLGVTNFLAQMSPEFVATMPETHRAIISARPSWATLSFGIAVFGGTLGCLLLLLKRPGAFYVYIVSFIAVIATLAPHLNLIGTVIIDPFEIFMMIVSSPAVAIFLIWYAWFARRKSWIR